MLFLFLKPTFLLPEYFVWGVCRQDLNFWGAVYPTYFALPYLKASRGNIVVTSSVAGRVPTARMSFYNVSY